jgi:hypothetical protein
MSEAVPGKRAKLTPSHSLAPLQVDKLHTDTLLDGLGPASPLTLIAELSVHLSGTILEDQHTASGVTSDLDGQSINIRLFYRL